jgi:hypothetical protein
MDRIPVVAATAATRPAKRSTVMTGPPPADRPLRLVPAFPRRPLRPGSALPLVDPSRPDRHRPAHRAAGAGLGGPRLLRRPR